MNSDAGSIAALVATVVSSMSCSGLRDLKQPMDLVGMAENVLRQLSETARRRPSLGQVKLVDPTVDSNDEALIQAVNTGVLLNVAQALVVATNKAILDRKFISICCLD